MDGVRLLRQARDAGLAVAVEGEKLVIRGPKRVELVARLLIEHKPEVMAALARAKPSSEADKHNRDPNWWRRHYLVRSINWELSGVRPAGRARGIAWGELEDRWHRLHGARTPEWQCAGCGEPLAGFPTLDLADGNCVHFHTLVCLLTFGKRWRAEAAAGLKALGLDPPEGCAP